MIESRRMVTRYYIISGVVTVEDVTFEDLDAQLNEISINLGFSFRGEAREFHVELEYFDEDTRNVEVIFGHTVYVWTDEEADYELILKEAQKEFEAIGILIDDIKYIGDRS